MRGHPYRPLLVGVPVGIAFVGLTLIAHELAGGRADAWMVVAASLTAIVIASILARARWSFGRLAIVAIGSQSALHLAFGHNAAGQHTMANASAHSDMAMSAHVGQASMLVAHALVAGATAVSLRWGHRWLRAMPGIGRALIMAGRGAMPVVAPRSRPLAPTFVDVGCAPLAVLLTWGTRGPP